MIENHVEHAALEKVVARHDAEIRGIVDDVSAIRIGVNSLISTQGKPNWAAIGVLLVFLSMFGAILWVPVDNEKWHVRAAIDALGKVDEESRHDRSAFLSDVKRIDGQLHEIESQFSHAWDAMNQMEQRNNEDLFVIWNKTFPDHVKPPPTGARFGPPGRH